VSTLTGHAPESASATRPALARAALLSDENGPATLAPELLVQAARHARYTADGPLEVILVARRLADARAAARLPGLLVVGIVAEEEEESAGDDKVPLLVGVIGARDTIAEGDLLIVDPARGRVVVQPDAVAIARVQAEPERPRVLLGSAYTPARTLNGRIIPVWATLSTPDDLQTALEAGADGLLLPQTALSELLRSDTADDAPNQDDAFSPFAAPPPLPPALLTLVDAVGGGDVMLQTSRLDTLDPVYLTHLSARCNLCWLLDPADVALAASDLRAELDRLAADEEDLGRPARAPRLAALIHASGAPAAATENAFLLAGFDEAVLFVGNVPDADPALREVLAAVTAGDTPLPLRVWLADKDGGDQEAWTGLLTHAVTHGAAGIIVAPSRVGAAKNHVRAIE